MKNKFTYLIPIIVTFFVIPQISFADIPATPNLSFLEALIVTLIIELLVAFFYLKSTKLSKTILTSVFVGNLITLPVVWFGVPKLFSSLSSLSSNFLLYSSLLAQPLFLLTEILVIVFEAYFIHYLNKQIQLKKSFILSVLMNLASAGGGFFLLFFLEALLQ